MSAPGLMVFLAIVGALTIACAIIVVLVYLAGSISDIHEARHRVTGVRWPADPPIARTVRDRQLSISLALHRRRAAIPVIDVDTNSTSKEHP